MDYAVGTKGGYPAFFSGKKVGLIYKMVWFNIKSGGRIWWVIIFDISLQRVAIECLGERSLTIKIFVL